MARKTPQQEINFNRHRYKLIYFTMTELEYFITETLDATPPPVTKENILKAVCLEFKVSEEAIMGNFRGQNTVLARHFYMFFLKHKGVIRTLTDIGREINKDHATVLYAIAKLKHWIENYQDIRQRYNNINQKLK